MSKRSGISFTRRAPDNITEELIAVLSTRASFEFKPLFDIILLNLRERNAASGGEEMLRLRAYEKLQGLVSQGAVQREVTGVTKKYKGVAARMAALRTEMKALRADCDERARAKAAAAS
jgi:hypothetical protein